MLAVDRAVVLGSALVVALFAACVAETSRVGHSLPAVPSTAAGIQRQSGDDPSPEEILDQVVFPPPAPICMLEVDELGNVLIPVQADAVVTRDANGIGTIYGADIRGSRCSRSVQATMDRTDGEFTVLCLPREYGLYERMNGRPAPGDP